MSVNRVSFGNVVDIKYRFKTMRDINKAEKKAQDDKNDIYNELQNNKSLDEARNLFIAKGANDSFGHSIIYRKFNRIITGDDCFTYDLLHKVNPEYANEFADNKAQTIIVDV